MAMGGLTAAAESVKRRAESAVGGPARLQIIAVLAAVLGLDTADKATVSALTGTLENVFHVGNTEIGILIAVVSFAGAVFTIPIGLLVDRFRRRSILLWAIALWSAAMAVSGLATSFMFLLVTRLFLGAITAAAWPAVASLSGDYFPPNERARTYGLILGGELVGTGVGFFLAGEISSLVSWRWPFFVMAALGAALLWAVWKFLPEPARGGQSWISVGQEEVRDEKQASEGTGDAGSGRSAQAQQVQRDLLQAGMRPREALVLHQDPRDRSLWWAIKYVVRIPTYDLVVAASALVYFFFAGVRAFAMPYLTAHYDVARSTMSGLTIVIGIGALAGVSLGGWLSEYLLGRGWFRIRIVMPGAALLLATFCFGPGIWTTSLVLGIALFTAGAFALAAANPPIDAARLDIMHPRLWGRAESGRMVLRATLEGVAPVLFGYVSDLLGGGESGLKWTYLIMLVPLLIASSLTIPASRTYPRDVATAGESVRRTSGRDE